VSGECIVKPLALRYSLHQVVSCDKAQTPHLELFQSKRRVFNWHGGRND
jgi:hypothetical protein